MTCAGGIWVNVENYSIIMLYVAIDSLQPGDKVARAIYGASGASATPLVATGTQLSEFEIRRLKALGYQGIYITVEAEQEDGPKPIISDATRAAAVERLTESFSALQQGRPMQTKPLQDSVDEMLGSILNETAILARLTDLRTHDNYTFEHSVNVAAVALMLGTELELSVERLRVLGLGALLHDIGKTALSPAILGKAGALTEDEYRYVRQHPQLGYEILRRYEQLDPAVAQIAYEHHERLNGTGYPRGLTLDEIDPLAKIVAVADVYDALTADRSYRKGMPTSKALAMLEGDMDSGFERNAVRSLLRRVAPYPLGTVVRLNTGHVATVVIVPQDVPERPSVHAAVDEDGRQLEEPLLYHLRHDPSLVIEEVIAADAVSDVDARIDSQLSYG